MKFDFKKYKKIHVIGVKGVGAAALAELLIKNGCLVTGSDIKEEFITNKPLEKAGIVIFEFGKNDFSGCDAVIRSVAYNSENNIDVKTAENLNIPIFTYPEVVASIFNSKVGVAVAGSHGKTTITAMLSDVLDKAGKNLNAIVGSRVNSWDSGAKTNALEEDGAIFVLEADEYRGAFLNYFPKCAILANIDYDHPDCYKTKKDYEDVFLSFVKNISDDGFLIANKDCPEIIKITENLKCKLIFYGKENLINFQLKFPGFYNQLNANAAYLCALELGVSKSNARKFLEEFSGTARRFNILGKKENAVIIDDYAHHPSEIKAVLSGVKEVFPNKKLIAIFQPHTYSRTKKFTDDFSRSFDDADKVILMSVFSSVRESLDGNVNVKDISDKIGKKAIFIKEEKKILNFLNKYLSDDSVIIFMGAGDIWRLAENLYQKNKG